MPAPTPPIALLLADDHVVVRRGLRLLLEQGSEFEVVAELGDAAEVPGAVRGGGVDVVLLDLNMPGEPLAVVSELAAEQPSVAVVVLTMEQDPAFARRALDAGARGYVLKRAAEEELVEAIRTVAGGGTHVSSAVAAALAAPAEPAASPGDLTPRETEVLRLIARGLTNAEVARELSLSVRTVETHRSHIQQKLLLSTRPDLVRYALEHGLI
ncbi:MAG TPA: response regulator transcription factor [Solirubrobacterales bacterium]|nr:response regulator transcription factor [Solirubrobacterales bacterium]